MRLDNADRVEDILAKLERYLPENWTVKRFRAIASRLVEREKDLTVLAHMNIWESTMSQLHR